MKSPLLKIVMVTVLSLLAAPVWAQSSDEARQTSEDKTSATSLAIEKCEKCMNAVPEESTECSQSRQCKQQSADGAVRTVYNEGQGPQQGDSTTVRENKPPGR